MQRLGAAIAVLVLTSVLWAPPPAAVATDPVCGTSGGHTLCISFPADTLTGEQVVTVTNSPNNGKVIFNWIPNGQTQKILIQTSFVSNPARPQNYSFVWPTQKYLDATGVLRAQYGSTTATPVDAPITLSNGNVSDFQHTPNDWQNYLPGAWSGTSDPVVASAGDGASNEKTSNGVAASIANTDPALFLYLGDVYEEGTFTEFRNHYGVSSIDVPLGGTMWGALADITQPTFGNHEVHNRPAFIDYWHNRPLYTSFTFGGVLFLDLWSSKTSFDASGQQYQWVQSQLANAPACVVAYWHQPVLAGDATLSKILPMWQLLANNGGDLTLNGDKHYMAEYQPMDAALQTGTAGAHQVQLIAGAGGHALSNTKIDSRTAWPSSPQKTAGAVYLTLVGAANGGQATAISWEFRNSSGSVLRSGSVTC
jgi:hypothetical protein